MSAAEHHNEHHDAHGEGHGHGDHGAHGHDDGPHMHVSFGGYMTGFILSVILTAIPFALVMGKAFSSSTTTSLVILTFAAVQIVVHMIFFLHMTPKAEGGWSMLALIFTTILVVITLSGSVWVLYHMNQNMMPMPADQMHQMP